MDKDGLLKQLESYKNELADVRNGKAPQSLPAVRRAAGESQERARQRAHGVVSLRGGGEMGRRGVVGQVCAADRASCLLVLEPAAPRSFPQLRVKQMASGTAAKLAHIKVVRKNIARVLTTYNSKRREEARASYAGKAFVPKTLRPKLTRAKRRALTDAQKAKVVPRIAKRVNNFPMRKFAVLA